jgi:HPt (histidine-containing phosphotransfer) domain-containing protein
VVRPPVFDRAAFAQQTGGDASLCAEIIQMFLEDCPVRVEEIRAAIDRRDAAALVSSAHALKGIGGVSGGPGAQGLRGRSRTRRPRTSSRRCACAARGA